MRAIVNWPAPYNGEIGEEAALCYDKGRANRVLIIPPLFDEANKLRRQITEVMYRLHISGIDSFLPDFPACHESQFPQEKLTLEILQQAAIAAAAHFKATHILAVRAGALYAPNTLPGWHYAASSGRKLLRPMLRARTISAQEAGLTETVSALEAEGLKQGITLSGWQLSAQMFHDLHHADMPVSYDGLIQLEQKDIGGGGLWLRAEPDEDPEQADMLATIIAIGLSGE